MESKIERILLIGLLVILVILLIFTAYSAAKPDYYGWQYKEFKNAENPDDKCKAPEGYTQEKWNEHMSHHPEQYEECFK